MPSRKKPKTDHEYRSFKENKDGTFTVKCDDCTEKPKWSETHPTKGEAEAAWRKHRGE